MKSAGQGRYVDREGHKRCIMGGGRCIGSVSPIRDDVSMASVWGGRVEYRFVNAGDGRDKDAEKRRKNDMKNQRRGDGGGGVWKEKKERTREPRIKWTKGKPKHPPRDDVLCWYSSI